MNFWDKIKSWTELLPLFRRETKPCSASSGPLPQAVCALIVDDTINMVLAISRKNNHNDFGLPGGKVESGESLEEALRREVREEVGVEINIGPSLLSVRNVNHQVTAYLCQIASGIPRTQSNEGVVQWVSWDKVSSGSFAIYNSQLRKIYFLSLKASQDRENLKLSEQALLEETKAFNCEIDKLESQLVKTKAKIYRQKKELSRLNRARDIQNGSLASLCRYVAYGWPEKERKEKEALIEKCRHSAEDERERVASLLEKMILEGEPIKPLALAEKIRQGRY